MDSFDLGFFLYKFRRTVEERLAEKDLPEDLRLLNQKLLKIFTRRA